jgi:hypothetical protein
MAKYTRAADQSSFAISISAAGNELPQTPKAARETTVREDDALAEDIEPTDAKSEVRTKTEAKRIKLWASEAPASLSKAARIRASGVPATANQEKLKGCSCCGSLRSSFILFGLF